MKEYDYGTPGFYFVTISAAERGTDLFSHLVPSEAVGAASLGGPHAETAEWETPKVVLTPIGEMIKYHIEKIDDLYANAHVDIYAIMTDHVHMIIQILGREDGPPREAAPTANLVKILDSFKGVTAHKAGFPLWQRSFYEHIIRNDEDLYNARRYVKYNAAKHYHLTHPEGHDTHA